MKRDRIYHDRRPLTMVLRVLAGVVIFAVAFCIFMFFWCRQYIVIEDGTLHLELPWAVSQEAGE